MLLISFNIVHKIVIIIKREIKINNHQNLPREIKNLSQHLNYYVNAYIFNYQDVYFF